MSIANSEKHRPTTPFPPRADVVFDRLGEPTASKLTSVGVIVLHEFTEPPETNAVRTTARNWLVPHTPIRAGRQVLKKAGADQGRLPSPLRVKPFQMPIDRASLLPPVVGDVVKRIEGINAIFFGFEPVTNIYGSESYNPDTIRFNRSGGGKTFDEHADTFAFGLAYILQTSPTRWDLSPTHASGGPASTTEPFSVFTDAGDLVVLLEKNQPELYPRENSEIPDITNSLTHRGTDLSGDTRFTLGAFVLKPKS